MRPLREGRRWFSATVDAIEEQASAYSSLSRNVVLRDARDVEGISIPGEVRMGYTGKLVGLGLAPGDRLTFAARLSAYDGDGKPIATQIPDVAAFFAALSDERHEAVHLRFLFPEKVHRTR